MLTSMTDHFLPNLDLGRDITSADIVGEYVFPLDKVDSGVYCYECQKMHNWSLGWSDGKLTPLTPSTGVYTALITCDQDSPVWVCLEHLPHSNHMFEAFTPELKALLIARQQARNRPAVTS